MSAERDKRGGPIPFAGRRDLAFDQRRDTTDECLGECDQAPEYQADNHEDENEPGWSNDRVCDGFIRHLELLQLLHDMRVTR
ncbi:hypothetical protein [Halalkalicoccus salilacus]|uniref:hypothetical protein n=1 Tax=Halalkalicoccus salilacus TaxID=3117459 RepID=UPI00300EDC78